MKFDFDETFDHFFGNNQQQFNSKLIEKFPKVVDVPVLFQLLESARGMAHQISWEVLQEYKTHLLNTYPELKRYKL